MKFSELEAVVVPEEGGYVAVWLERDVVGQGKTPERALENLWVAVLIHEAVDLEEGRVPFSELPLPPEGFRA
jgi:predicted RNase H-like HicB family nuclease